MRVEINGHCGTVIDTTVDAVGEWWYIRLDDLPARWIRAPICERPPMQDKTAPTLSYHDLPPEQRAAARDQIARELQAGTPATVLSRRYQISVPTVYAWSKHFSSRAQDARDPVLIEVDASQTAQPAEAAQSQASAGREHSEEAWLRSENQRLAHYITRLEAFIGRQALAREAIVPPILLATQKNESADPRIFQGGYAS
jgi:hypothetical protein